MIKKQTENYSNKNGFVALFAVLVASIVLTISFGILSIALKEIILSSTSRESQTAFYSADTGVECALYWDIKESSFPTSTESSVPVSGVFCNGEDITTERGTLPVWNMEKGVDFATTTFWFTVGSDEACAKVQVGKKDDKTTIDSRGYNICSFDNPRAVERGIRVSF